MASSRMGTGRALVVTLLSIILLLVFGSGFLWWYDRNVEDISFIRTVLGSLWCLAVLGIVALIAVIARRRRRRRRRSS